MAESNPDRSGPIFNVVESGVTIGGQPVKLYTCEWCGSVVTPDTMERHGDWHGSLNKTAEKARDADLHTRLIG